MYSQLVRFGFVGISGACINFLVFAVAVKALHLGHNFSATVAFLVAATSNYTFNRLWTFRSSAGTTVGYGMGLWKYVTINLLGFGVNLVVLNSIILWAGNDRSLEGQGLGILGGMLFNFFISRALVFKKGQET